MANKDRSSQPYIGRAVPRLEDEPLLTGRATFVADLAFPDQCHMMVVRAPISHGALRSVDIRAAAAAIRVGRVGGSGGSGDGGAAATVMAVMAAAAAEVAETTSCSSQHL